MKFSEVVAQVVTWLQRDGRVSYRALKREFDLDDEFLADVTTEIVEAQRLATDEDGRFLVWTGKNTEREKAKKGSEKKKVVSSQFSVVSPYPSAPSVQPLGERRQLTVEFIDLVGSTMLSQQLDPEDYHARVRAYQATCYQVIQRYDGYIAQYLGDGMLVYFGYPVAHEDDAVRAVRSGLEVVAVVGQLEYTPRLQVRVGIHTGPVVVSEIGAGEHNEQLALGETPNIAARVQGLAEPGTVVMSAATSQLVQGLFECRDLGRQTLKGISLPMTMYRIVDESVAHSRFEATVQKGLMPLVGRAEELALLQRGWARVKAGAGQVILLSGEAGIGKSRLVQELKEQLACESVPRIEFRCSPYHQNSAFYPISDHLQRLLQFARDDAPATKLEKLQQMLSLYHFPQPDTVPLLAAFLSLPHPAGYPALTLNPQKQKQKTHEVLLAWLLEEAERAPVYCLWEDLHWADPSTLEFLRLCLDQAATARLLLLLTFRPDFTPPWGLRSYFTLLTLLRLGRQQVETMVAQVTGSKTLPAEIVEQVVARTDGVPLFVEELTKMVAEQEIGVYGHTPLLRIPATLQDALMARLDQLGPAKEVVQLGATLGREFSYELIQAIAPLEEETLQQSLSQAVAAELIYCRGFPPDATYSFKHVLVQDTAYESLLKSKRRQLHEQIAQVLEAQFPEVAHTQPELLAHHYTEARLNEKAIPYWNQAGQGAIQRAAFTEALSHLTNGLNLLQTLSESPERDRHELELQSALGLVLQTIKGYAAPEVDHAYTRARWLCQQVGDAAQLMSVLRGQVLFYGVRADYGVALELGQQMLTIADRAQAPEYQIEAHLAIGLMSLYLGKFLLSRTHLERSIAIDTLEGQPLQAFQYLGHSRAMSFSYLGRTLWLLGYPDQALQRSQEGLSLAQTLSIPMTLAQAQGMHTLLYQVRRESELAQEWAEKTIAYASEQGFPYWLTLCTMVRGWLLDHKDQSGEGSVLFSRGLAGYRATGARLGLSWLLALSAEAAGNRGQSEEGLQIMAEALTHIDHSTERYYEAEVYRLKGELLLTQEGKKQKAIIERQKFEEARDWMLETGSSSPHAPSLPKRTSHWELDPAAEAEACFLKAIEIARTQHAKSWELRAATSLARLWQQQGRYGEARELLATVYGWFTEGFATPDLQEAKALLAQLS